MITRINFRHFGNYVYLMKFECLFRTMLNITCMNDVTTKCITHKQHVNIRLCTCKHGALHHDPLLWRHSGLYGVSNHQPHESLLSGLFRRRSRKHQSSASLAFVRRIHRWPVNSPHKWPVTRKCFHLMTSSWTIHQWACQRPPLEWWKI